MEKKLYSGLDETARLLREGRTDELAQEDINALVDFKLEACNTDFWRKTAPDPCPPPLKIPDNFISGLGYERAAAMSDTFLAEHGYFRGRLKFNPAAALNYLSSQRHDAFTRQIREKLEEAVKWAGFAADYSRICAYLDFDPLEIPPFEFTWSEQLPESIKRHEELSQELRCVSDKLNRILKLPPQMRETALWLLIRRLFQMEYPEMEWQTEAVCDEALEETDVWWVK